MTGNDGNPETRATVTVMWNPGTRWTGQQLKPWPLGANPESMKKQASFPLCLLKITYRQQKKTIFLKVGSTTHWIKKKRGCTRVKGVKPNDYPIQKGTKAKGSQFSLPSQQLENRRITTVHFTKREFPLPNMVENKIHTVTMSWASFKNSTSLQKKNISSGLGGIGSHEIKR